MDKQKYVTIEEGIDFRTIAKIMTNNGYKMNHATARNVLITAIKKVFNFAAEKINTKISDNEMQSLIVDPNVHIALADLIYKEINNDKKIYFNKEAQQ